MIVSMPTGTSGITARMLGVGFVSTFAQSSGIVSALNATPPVKSS